MDSGSDNESANGDGPKRRRRLRSATDRAAAKAARQQRKREQSEARIREREQSLGGEPEPKRKRRVRRLLPQPPGPEDGDKRTKPKLRKLRFAFVILGLAALAFVSWIFGIMMAVAQDLPSLENREQYKRAENSVVYDSYGNKLATLTNNQGRILLSSDEIAPVMKEAMVAIEDQRFYEHAGSTSRASRRAVWQDVTSGSAQQGASTITQQFVKNALAAQDSRTVFQKLREAALAYHLERQWSKDKILTEYLNEIYFGEGAYGIEAAAQHLLRLQPPRLRRGRRRPTRARRSSCPGRRRCSPGSSPRRARTHPETSPRTQPRAATRCSQNMARRGLHHRGGVHRVQRPSRSRPRSRSQPPAENSAAPYFTSWLRQQLVDRYGAGEAFGGGLQINSTLDLEFQDAVQADRRSRRRRRSRRPPRPWSCSTTRRGGVLAMVGGSDYQEPPFNLATTGPPPARLVVQAVHAGDRARAGRLARRGLHLRAAADPVPDQGGEEERQGRQDRPRPVPGQQLRRQLPRLRIDRQRRRPTPTTPSTHSSAPRSGPQNVAATANRMGIETDLGSTKGYEYSIEGGPFAAVQPGADPRWARDRRHPARDGARLQHARGRRQAALGHDGIELRRPGRDLDVTDGGDCQCYQGGDPVADQTGASGVNKLSREAGDRPDRRGDRQDDALDRGHAPEPAQRAQTGDPTWGKTGTTDDNGDAWFCGATPKITAASGSATADSVTPMETEFGGATGGRRHVPRPDLPRDRRCLRRGSGEPPGRQRP